MRACSPFALFYCPIMNSLPHQLDYSDFTPYYYEVSGSLFSNNRKN